MKTIFLVATLLLVFAGPVHAAHSGSCSDAPQTDDHAAALSEIQSLADQGDARAQHNLGCMYLLGRGVAQSDVEAVKWFRRAKWGRFDSVFL